MINQADLSNILLSSIKNLEVPEDIDKKNKY